MGGGEAPHPRRPRLELHLLKRRLACRRKRLLLNGLAVRDLRPVLPGRPRDPAFASATSDTPYFFASLLPGIDQTSRYSVFRSTLMTPLPMPLWPRFSRRVPPGGYPVPVHIAPRHPHNGLLRSLEENPVRDAKQAGERRPTHPSMSRSRDPAGNQVLPAKPCRLLYFWRRKYHSVSAVVVKYPCRGAACRPPTSRLKARDG